MTPVTQVTEVLQEIIDRLTDPLATQPSCVLQPPPCRYGIVPGLEVAWDSCGRTDCVNETEPSDGQLFANVMSINPVSGQGAASGNCIPLLWTAGVGIVRCAATMKEDGSPPNSADVEADAWQQAGDADQIRAVLQCCRDETDRSPGDSIGGIEVVSWTPLGPAGGCVGGLWTIRGYFDGCC